MAVEPEDFAGKVLRLHSPTSQGILEISWPENKDKEICQVRIKELLDTIKFVCDDFKQLQMGLKSYAVDFDHKKSFKNAQILVDKFNKSVQLYVKMNKGTQEFSARCQQKASSSLLDHILRQVYRQSITDPQLLNQYQSFSSETYGETNYQQMERIINELQWTDNDVFVDLGSGIGSIVMQVASATGVSRAVGIEIQPNPNKCAKKMDENFRKMMRWYGKIFNQYELYDGNFLEKNYRDVRTSKEMPFNWQQEATIIFVNNYAFAESLNLQLKGVFADMPQMTKIISTKAFSPVDFTINPRNAGNDIGCFMRVKELQSIQDGFSWTDKVVQVFLSTIDHTKLAEFYDKQNEKKNKVVGSKDRSSSNSPIDFVENPVKKIKTAKELRKMSKGKLEVDFEPKPAPPVSKKEAEKLKKQNGRGRPPNKATKYMQDSNVKNAFDVFHKDQVNSHKNNHSARQSLVSNKQIDDAWEKATQEWKKQFHDAVSTFLNMSQNRLDRLFEGERASLAKLDQMVKDEENKIAELRQSHTKRCRQSIATQCDIRDKKLIKRESQVDDEDRHIRMLQHQILGNQTRIRQTKHPGLIKIENGVSNTGACTAVRPTIIKQSTQFTITNAGRKKPSTETDGPPKFGSTFSNPMPSPHSIPPSPHSIKSSPSSDLKSSDPHTNALLDAGLQSQIVNMSPRTEKERLKQPENPANHFPINLTPTPTLQNSCESGNNSPSSSIYGSPRSKRQRLKSIDSDRSDRQINRSNQQSVITASTVQTSTSSTQRHKNTSNQSRVPQPQHLMVQQPVLIPGVINGGIIAQPGQPGVNGRITHSTVLRQPQIRPDLDPHVHHHPNSDKPIEQHAHLYGGLHNGFIQNPAGNPNILPNNTDANKDVKEKKIQQVQQAIPVSLPNGGIHMEAAPVIHQLRIPGYAGFPHAVQYLQMGQHPHFPSAYHYQQVMTPIAPRGPVISQAQPPKKSEK